MRAIFEPALDWKQWKTPNQRRISLYTEQDRKQATSIEQQAQQVDEERAKVVQGHLDRTLMEEQLIVPENLRKPLQAAFKTPAKERTAKQVELLDEYPNVGKISSGSLYLYNRKRSQRAAGIETLAQQKEENHLQRVRQAQLALVPAPQREAIVTALAVTAKERSEDQKKLLEQFPGPAVTSATLKDFDAAAAAEIAHYRQVAKVVKETDSAKELDAFSDKAKKIRETLDVLNRVFPYRPCEGPTPGRHSGVPCLDFHIDRCLGPCVGSVSKEDYAAVIDGVADLFLRWDRG